MLDFRMLSRLDRYLFRSAGTTFLACIVVLAAMIWATQALREIDIMTSQGQTILAFLFITSLTMPMLILGLAPAALYMAVSHTLFKLNGDSEIVVMSAAGISTWRMLRPLMLLAIVVSLACAALSIELVPASLRQFRYEVTRIRADVVAYIAQPGRFTTITKGLVFHVRERSPNGVLGGIFINDARLDTEVNTYLADRGQIVDTDKGTFLVLEKGAIHRRTPGKTDNSVVEFERYAFDLSPFASSIDGTSLRPPERSFTDIAWPDVNDSSYKRDPGRFTEELHRRLSLPLYVLAFFALAAASLAEPRTTRESRGLALVAAIPVVVVLQVVNFGLMAQIRHAPELIPFVYLAPLIVIFGSALFLSGRFRPRLPAFIGRAIDGMAQRVVRSTVQ